MRILGPLPGASQCVHWIDQFHLTWLFIEKNGKVQSGSQTKDLVSVEGEINSCVFKFIFGNSNLGGEHN